MSNRANIIGQPGVTMFLISQAMSAISRKLGLALPALGLAACMSSPAPAPLAALPSDAPRPVTGWLAGPAAEGLDPMDRDRAFAAQISAAETGRRASWRSAKGHFGFVEPGAEAAGAPGVCRPFSHTIYIDGRAQRGTGTACRSAAGIWDVVS